MDEDARRPAREPTAVVPSGAHPVLEPAPTLDMLTHDLNNLLATIHLASDMLSHAPSLDERARRQAQAILQASVRGRDLVQRLGRLARPSRADRVPVDLASEIKTTVQLFTAAHERQSIQLRIAEVVPDVPGYPDLIHSALMNLLINAYSHGGATAPIEIACELVALNAVQALATHAQPPIAAGRYCLLRVIDGGAGMSPAVLARCMEPHFSTKGDHGHGLGLPSVLACMQEHHGGLSVSSQLGRGTCVTAWFPLT